jgi:EAL domain-containing protein (putative c-di-GMP-specific phosphodiesterase class I)
MRDMPEAECIHHNQPDFPSGGASAAQLIGSIRLRYQPIIRLATMRPESVEVLTRRETADGRLIGPETIVDAMTGGEISLILTGAILQLTLAEYTAHGFAGLPFSFAINLPLDALLHPDLIVLIETIRVTYNVPPQRITFELTERHRVDDIARVGGVVAVLREAGYRLALDDITPDMPNLPGLLDLPVSAIKLDRSIAISRRKQDQVFIRRIAAQAAARQQIVIAEGIETPATLARMRDCGATHGQGFLLAEPMPAAALPDFVRDWPAVRP